jgi:hypothetical protein
MNDTFAIQVLTYTHVTALSLWMGGLFGYAVIVWPAIMSDASGRFPRALLATIAVRTAPWIYAAMVTALLTFAAISLIDTVPVQRFVSLMYGLLLIALIGNNVYGTVVAWPRMMLLPFEIARREWFWFRVRMGMALVVGIGLYSAAVYYGFNRH